MKVGGCLGEMDGGMDRETGSQDRWTLSGCLDRRMDSDGQLGKWMEYHAIQNSLECSAPSMSRHPWEWRWRVAPRGSLVASGLARRPALSGLSGQEPWH